VRQSPAGAEELRTGLVPASERRTNPAAITMAYVAGLANPDFLVEMDAIAVVPL
jgi:enamine deaminase RidA (YjgF/YER057c/UK114 family)